MKYIFAFFFQWLKEKLTTVKQMFRTWYDKADVEISSMTKKMFLEKITAQINIK